MIEVKERLLERRWGFLVTYEVYSDGVLVAIKNGGHFEDLPTRTRGSLSFDRDGDVVYSSCSENDFTTPFEMTEEIKRLCEEKVPLKRYYVKWYDEKSELFVTYNEAKAHPLYQKRRASIEEIPYSIP